VEECTVELETLKDLYIDELKDLWSAEKQLVQALPRMAKAATDPRLAKAFTNHLRQTERQVARLERIFKDLGESPRGKKCVGMEGLIEEAKELIKEKPEPQVLDAGLISKAQHVEHYEMAGYGTVRTYAQVLGEERQAQLLQETLDEEGAADKLLTQLAENSINVEAAEGAEEEDEATTQRGKSRGGRTAKKATSTAAERELTRRAAVEGGDGAVSSAASRRSGGRATRDTEATSR
jgi:ferritin-like metal-binding protein YciE